MGKIIYLTKYTSLGASSRLRSIQFIPFLQKKGYQVSYSALFGDNYLKALYGKKRIKYLYLLLGYLRRFIQLFSLYKFDVVIIEKELFPYLPAWFEIMIKKIGINYFVDYDDAIFHNYDLSQNKLIKRVLSNKIDLVMKNSKTVFAGNSYLAKRAILASAPKTIILPTVIDIDKYVFMDNKDPMSFVLGWIGSPSTYKYIEELFPVFYKLKEKYANFYVNIIGAKLEHEKRDFINFIPWSESTEVKEINKFDLGIMPLHETPWELGKCSYKLIQYMGCGVAVLASPIGMNKDVVIDNYNGELVQNGDWFIYIERYIEDVAKLREQGLKGRDLVETKFNIHRNLEIIIDAIEN